MPSTVRKGSKGAPPISQQNTWLDSMPSTQRVLGKNGVPPQEKSKEEEQERHQAEKWAIAAREGMFWCKITETFSSRIDGEPNTPVSGHWFHNREKDVLEMYGDLRQPPVHTKEVFLFNKRAK
jgi:hypothetical protein